VDNVKKRSEDFFESPVDKSSNPYINKEKNVEKKTIKCQYCGEEIVETVINCPFCGSYLR
jgi:DNA-directed RNA polymerase subunit RPC12/RpoP